MSTQHHRRAAAAGLAVAALAAGALSASPTATAARPVTDSPIRLLAPDSLTVRSHDGYVYSDFGLEMAAQHQDFEIRANRETYDDLITAVWQRGPGVEDDVAIPENGMPTWQGLDGFTKVVIRKEGRKRPVNRMQVTGCFNSWDSRPVSPDHASGNDYPWSCPYNAYTIGSVMGIAEGYAVSALGSYGYYASPLEVNTRLPLPPGRYLVRASIKPEIATALGVSSTDATATTKLVVPRAQEPEHPGHRHPMEGPGRTAHEPTPRLQPGARPAAQRAGAPAGLLPDLRSLPSFLIELNPKQTQLRFGATVWNGGKLGARPRRLPQRRRRVQDRHLPVLLRRRRRADRPPAGRVDDVPRCQPQPLALRGLRPRTASSSRQADGRRSSKKISFCLANTDAVDYTIPNADWRPENTDLSSDCGGRGATYLRQVLSNGSGDTYFQYRAGQAFRVGKLPDGDYWISVNANPDGNLQELDETNNESLRKITLTTNRRGVRKVEAAPVGIINEWESWYRQAAR